MEKFGKSLKFTTIVKLQCNNFGVKIRFNKLFKLQENKGYIGFAFDWKKLREITEIINKRNIVTEAAP